MSRIKLHNLLCEILGSENVYFQPPESVKIKYPAIIYELDNVKNAYADNEAYMSRKRYAFTLIDKNPDTKTFDKAAALPFCKFNRHYKSDNLNHYTFIIYI